MGQAPLQDALIGLVARVGILGGDVPAVNAAVRATGVELDAVRPVVPPGAAETLGGRSLDATVDLAMAPDILDCRVHVRTAGGHLPMTIGGTPKKPTFDASNALFGLATHGIGGVGKVAGNVGDAGVKTVGAAADTATTAVKGAGKAVDAVGKGLFKSITSLGKGDLKGAAKGATDATVGAAGEAGKAVTDSAKAGQEGVGEAAKTGTGRAAVEAWRAAVPQRWDEGWPKAQEKVAAMPFPKPAGKQEGTEAQRP
jgi:hypothetical protein